jgi:hypothetical protein
MGVIDTTLTKLSYFHFWTDDPTKLGIVHVAANAFGYLALFTSVVACSGTITFTYPIILAAAFGTTALLHIIQLKELRIQNKY